MKKPHRGSWREGLIKSNSIFSFKMTKPRISALIIILHTLVIKPVLKQYIFLAQLTFFECNFLQNAWQIHCRVVILERRHFFLSWNLNKHWPNIVSRIQSPNCSTFVVCRVRIWENISPDFFYILLPIWKSYIRYTTRIYSDRIVSKFSFHSSIL